MTQKHIQVQNTMSDVINQLILLTFWGYTYGYMRNIPCKFQLISDFLKEIFKLTYFMGRHFIIQLKSFSSHTNTLQLQIFLKILDADCHRTHNLK